MPWGLLPLNVQELRGKKGKDRKKGKGEEKKDFYFIIIKKEFNER